MRINSFNQSRWGNFRIYDQSCTTNFLPTKEKFYNNKLKSVQHGTFTFMWPVNDWTGESTTREVNVDKSQSFKVLSVDAETSVLESIYLT